MRKRIDAGDHQSLADYPSLGRDARMSIPTPEHYLPLLYVLALQEKGETPAYMHDKVMTSISMTSVLIGA